MSRPEAAVDILRDPLMASGPDGERNNRSMDSQKRKGRFLFRDLAPAFRLFRRPGSASGLQLIAISELFGTCELARAFPHTSVITLAVRASSGSIHEQTVS
jgi:hypothetical protein